MNGKDDRVAHWIRYVQGEPSDTFTCSRCGATTKLDADASFEDFARFYNEFIARHVDCQPAKDGAA